MRKAKIVDAISWNHLMEANAQWIELVIPVNWYHEYDLKIEGDGIIIEVIVDGYPQLVPLCMMGYIKKALEHHAGLVMDKGLTEYVG